MIRVIVCGGRDFNERDFIHNTLCDLDAQHGPFDVIVHGAATGADNEGMIWAQTMGRRQLPMVADWHRHGRAAGPIRNQRMIDDGKPDLVVAFPGGKGTADMVKRAKAAGIKVIEVPHGSQAQDDQS